jgi:hypothetical protein
MTYLSRKKQKARQKGKIIKLFNGGYAKVVERKGWTYYHTKNLIGAADGEDYPPICTFHRRKDCERLGECQQDTNNGSRNLKNCRRVLLQRYLLVRGGDDGYFEAEYAKQRS